MVDEVINRAKLEAGFRVGGHLVEPRLQRITKGDETVQVEPKVMEVLLCLAENPGQPVSKAQFMEEVWTDTIVTEDALLRCISELRKIFDDDARDPTYIETIRKRGYRLIAPVAFGSDPAEGNGAAASVDEAELPADGGVRRLSQKNIWIGTAALVVIVFLAVLWIGRFFPADFAVPLHPVPLTSYPGEEADPNLSPNGEQIAFVWDGGNGGSFDIYIKQLDAASPQRLTDTPADDLSPAWSPDGKQIAFLRTLDGSSAVYVKPVLGGSARLLADLGHREAHALAWSPDGETLAFTAQRDVSAPFSIWLLSLASLELRAVTDPPLDYRGDRELAYSPDGRYLAFSRSVLEKVDDVFVLSLQTGTTRRLTSDHSEVTGVDWTADGRHIVFTSDREAVPSLWRVPATGGSPIWIPTAGEGYGVHQPSISREGERLTFVQSNREVNVWDVSANLTSASEAQRDIQVVTSTRWDSNPALSPDGGRIAFASNRSGSYEVWVSERDGSDPTQLTSLRGPFMETPRWSPDGRRLAFVAKEQGSSDIYIVDAAGGAPRRLTTAASNDKAPYWSRDGEWIYFASNRTGAWETWRIHLQGEQREQVTTNGGFAAAETYNGDGLYFTKRDAPGLWLLPDDGGSEQLVLNDLQPYDWGNWAVAADGLYYVRRRGAAQAVLAVYDPVTGHEHVVRSLDRVPRHPSLTVSSDGRRILCSRIDRSDSDILLVEEFR